MAVVWITYTWADNEQDDIDFIAQELESFGVDVKLDKLVIGAGKRMWDQIATAITDSKECDAWILVATPKSLQSEPCTEERAYALDRALRSNGAEFPIIGLFQDSVESDLIPPAIRTRLCVSLTDPDWKERIKAAAEGRLHSASRPAIEPYYFKIQRIEPKVHLVPRYPSVKNSPMREHKVGQDWVIEVRPRAGVWGPFFAEIPFAEKEKVNPNLEYGNANKPSINGVLLGYGTQQMNDLWVMSNVQQSTPTMSYYIWCDSLPSILTFGMRGGPEYVKKIPQGG